MSVMSPSVPGNVNSWLWIGCLLWLSLTSANADASSFNPRGYVSVNAQQHRLRVGGTHFTMPAASIAGGYWFRDGIGLEIELGSSRSGDKRHGIKLELDQLLSLGVRLEAPPSENLALYFVFSLAAADISSQFSEIESRSFDSSLNGYGATFGMTWHSSIKGLVVNVGVGHNRFESNLGTNTFQFGLRYAIGATR